MRQKWGQNFLIDKAVAGRIVNSLDMPCSRVLEVGPGRGILTQFLLEKTSQVTVVELDRRLAAGLQARWPSLEVAAEDFLKWPLPDWPENSCQFIGNLPYSAGNAILRKILDWKAWSAAVVMVQKEVADRMTARPNRKDYGVLTLAVQGKAEAEALFDVPPGCFRPAPKVFSTVVRLRRRPRSRIEDEKRFFDVVHAAFSQRRKTLLNALSHGLSLDKPVALASLEKAGIRPERRAETLGLEEFNRLTRELPA